MRARAMRECTRDREKMATTSRTRMGSIDAWTEGVGGVDRVNESRESVASCVGRGMNARSGRLDGFGSVRFETRRDAATDELNA